MLVEPSPAHSRHIPDVDGLIPALEVASSAGSAARFGVVPADVCEVVRAGRNDWIVVVGSLGDDAVSFPRVVRAVSPAWVGHRELPSRLLGRLNRVLWEYRSGWRRGSGAGSCTIARLELDVCGAWVTLCAAGRPRPVVVRAAGWVDLRGQPGPPVGMSERGAFADDRVGLGPGDALVIVTERGNGADPDPALDRDLLESLLDVTGGPATEMAAAATSAGRVSAPHERAVVVLRVPPAPPEEHREAVAAVTGLDPAELGGPKYPLGDVHPDVWSRRVLPPREARMRIGAEPSEVPRARAVLRRLMHSWRMSGEAFDDLELLATELITNAIRHTDTATVTMLARYDGEKVRVEIGDESPRLPRPGRPETDETSGRGLLIVGAVAHDWGVAVNPDGKRVWFETPID